MDKLIPLLQQVSLLLWIYATGWFMISVLLKRNDVADIAWGLGYGLVCLFLAYTQPVSSVSMLLYILVWVWGLRLSIYIYLRNRKKPEDYRYKQWREEWGKTFFWRSYLQVYLLQAFFLFIIILPVIWASLVEPAWTGWTTVGLVVWMTGFYFQSMGDYQLSAFIKTKKPGEIMQKGLWKYSRHPNYFGEILMWWGIFIIVLPMPYGFLFLVSPLTITGLLAFVSGVPMLEEKYKNNSAYTEYKKSTPALVPKFRLNKR